MFGNIFIMKILLLFGLLTVACRDVSVNHWRRFPEDFLFGCATAAYQIEGAWHLDGKGENIWDHLTHFTIGKIKDKSDGKIAADSYHNYMRDVEIMRELGLDAYRFSLSWSRILPTGFNNPVNSAGIAYYNNLIDEMVTYNITPIITLYHWDLPQKLQDLGGFVNPLIVNWFEDFARIAFINFGDRVKHWITFNEPREICHDGYGSANKAPLLNSAAFGTYLCTRHLLLAHANAYHAYKNDFQRYQGGQCGITISVHWFEPATNQTEDVFAAELTKQAEWGLYAEPIFSTKGGFPKDFSDRVAKKSKDQGYSKSRLPEFNKQEKHWVRGSYDFFGVNHYTAWQISATEYKYYVEVPSIRNDLDVGFYQPKDWPSSASSWLKRAPNSLFNAIMDLHKRYQNVIFYITENGWSTTATDVLTDDKRVAYHRAALENVLDLLDAGVKVKGYMAWSMIDSFEWMEGYTERFGLYHVDFNSPARTRTPRKSAFVYKHIVKNRHIDPNYEPKNKIMTIDKGYYLLI